MGLLADIVGKTTVALCCVVVGHVLVPRFSWIASIVLILVLFRLWAHHDPDKVFIASIVAAVACGVFAVTLNGSVHVARNETKLKDAESTSEGLTPKQLRAHAGSDDLADPILGGSAFVQVIRPQIELKSETFHLCEGDNSTVELTFILRADPGEEQVSK
jgi:hypothetical protein